MMYLTKYLKQKELTVFNLSDNPKDPTDYKLEDVKFVDNWVDQLSYKEKRVAYQGYIKNHRDENPMDDYPYRTYGNWKEMEEAFVYAEIEENGGRIFLYPCEA